MPRTVSPVKTPSTIRRTFTPELPDRAPGVPTGAAGEVARAAGGALAADPTGSGPVFAPHFAQNLEESTMGVPQFVQNLAIRPPPAPSSMGELVCAIVHPLRAKKRHTYVTLHLWSVVCRSNH